MKGRLLEPRKRLGLWIVMAALLVLSVAGGSYGDAQLNDGIPKIYVGTNDSLIITVPNVTRVAVGNPAVIDAAIVSPDEVLINGASHVSGTIISAGGDYMTTTRTVQFSEGDDGGLEANEEIDVSETVNAPMRYVAVDSEEASAGREEKATDLLGAASTFSSSDVDYNDLRKYFLSGSDYLISNLYVWSNNQRYIYKVVLYDSNKIAFITDNAVQVDVEPTGIVLMGEVPFVADRESVADFYTSRGLAVVSNNLHVKNTEPLFNARDPYITNYIRVSAADIQRAIANRTPIVGMTRDQVESIAGAPVRQSEMIQDPNTGYIVERVFYRRNVVFYHNDHAMKVQEPYYANIDFDAEVVTQMIPVYLRPASDFREILSNIYGENITVQIDNSSNTILLRGAPKDVVEVIDTINALDNRSAQQVLIEARFVELTRNASDELGVAWGLGGQNSDGNRLGVDFNADASVSAQPGFANPSANYQGGLRFGTIDATTGKFSAMTLQDLDMIISALERNGSAEILSAPRIVTLNNQEATLRSIRTVYDRTVNESRNDQGQPTFTQQLTPREVGIVLNVTPTIGRDGIVTMALNPEVSVLVGTIPANPGANDPIINVIDERTTESTVMLRSGTTLVIGGLISQTRRENTEKVPFLGSLPLLGRLFRSDTTNEDLIDLVIFLTARVIPPDGSLPDMGSPVRAQIP